MTARRNTPRETTTPGSVGKGTAGPLYAGCFSLAPRQASDSRARTCCGTLEEFVSCDPTPSQIASARRISRVRFTPLERLTHVTPKFQPSTLGFFLRQVSKNFHTAVAVGSCRMREKESGENTRAPLSGVTSYLSPSLRYSTVGYSLSSSPSFSFRPIFFFSPRPVSDELAGAIESNPLLGRP